MTKGATTRSFDQNIGGSWWELGIGTNINLNENTHIYLDLQKTCNGKINTPWQWNAGIRCSF